MKKVEFFRMMLGGKGQGCVVEKTMGYPYELNGMKFFISRSSHLDNRWVATDEKSGLLASDRCDTYSACVQNLKDTEQKIRDCIKSFDYERYVRDFQDLKQSYLEQEERLDRLYNI